MATLAKAQLIEPVPPWGAAFDRMYLELCQNRVPILTALGFYAEHDLSPPESSDVIPMKDEEGELRQIASALTVAAAASATTPTGVLVATLQNISKQPSLFLAGRATATRRMGNRGRLSARRRAARNTLARRMGRPGCHLTRFATAWRRCRSIPPPAPVTTTQPLTIRAWARRISACAKSKLNVSRFSTIFTVCRHRRTSINSIPLLDGSWRSNATRSAPIQS
jgi:hypothetical protein